MDRMSAFLAIARVWSHRYFSFLRNCQKRFVRRKLDIFCDSARSLTELSFDSVLSRTALRLTYAVPYSAQCCPIHRSVWLMLSRTALSAVPYSAQSDLCCPVQSSVLSNTALSAVPYSAQSDSCFSVQRSVLSHTALSLIHAFPYSAQRSVWLMLFRTALSVTHADSPSCILRIVIFIFKSSSSLS